MLLRKRGREYWQIGSEEVKDRVSGRALRGHWQNEQERGQRVIGRVSERDQRVIGRKRSRGYRQLYPSYFPLNCGGASYCTVSVAGHATTIQTANFL